MKTGSTLRFWPSALSTIICITLASGICTQQVGRTLLTEWAPVMGGDCVPEANSEKGSVGKCVASDALNICEGMDISDSEDCATLNEGNALCCYTVGKKTLMGPASATIDPRLTSTMNPAMSPASVLLDHTSPSASAGDTCGVPNGNVSIFTSIENMAGSQRENFAASSEFWNVSSAVHDKIVGGFEAPNGSASLCWQVAVLPYYRNGSAVGLCGGVIVGSRTILTAAHCLVYTTVADFNSSDYFWLVQIGAITVNTYVQDPLFNQTVMECAEILTGEVAIPHPNFTLDTFDNDIGIIILSVPIDFSAQRQCACKLCLSAEVPYPGDRCIVSGFGREVDTSAPGAPPVSRINIPLKYVEQTILAPSYERCAYADDGYGHHRTDLNLFLCAGGVVGEDSCNGDSGGPFFCYSSSRQVQYLAGIVSYGVGCANGTGSLYTKVAKYLSWIFQTAPPGDVSLLT